MGNYENFAEFLKSKRQEAELSQHEVSAQLGYTGPQFISNLERGISQLPIYKIPVIAKLYGIPVQDLVDEVISEHTRVLRSKIEKTLKKHQDSSIN